jgi:hypothetical protein
MLVSALWGVLFLTNSLQVWEACLLSSCTGARERCGVPASS